MTDQTGMPAGWTRTTIGDVFAPLHDGRTLHQGWSPQCDDEPAADGEWGVLRTTAIQEGSFLPEHNKRLPPGLDPRPAIAVEPGDILLTCAGPRSRCGVPCLVRATRPRLMMSGKMYRFRVPSDLMSAAFVEAFLMSSDAQAAIDRMKTGGSDSGLNLTQERFRQLPIVVAPTAEQRRIVEAIDSYLTRLDDAVATLERVQAKLKSFRASVLKAAVEGRLVPTDACLARVEKRGYEPAEVLLARILQEHRRGWEDTELARLMAAGRTPRDDRWKAKYPEPVASAASVLPELPEGWCWAPMSALLSEPLRNGHSAREAKGATGIRTLTLSAVTEADFGVRNTKLTVAEPGKVADLWLRPGDIFVERSNTPELVGLAALYKGEASFAVFPDLLVRVRCTKHVMPEFIEAVLLSSRSRSYFQKAAKGIAGSMPKISQGTIEGLAVPLPPLAEQQRIVDQLQRLQSVAGSAQHEVVTDQLRCRRLRQAVLKWALEGDRKSVV